jgi:hypothetical protein
MRFFTGVCCQKKIHDLPAFPTPTGLYLAKTPLGEFFCPLLFLGAATFVPDGASYQGAVGLYRRAADGSKMMSMAGCLPRPKRFRHGRPDRGRC